MWQHALAMLRRCLQHEACGQMLQAAPQQSIQTQPAAGDGQAAAMEQCSHERLLSLQYSPFNHPVRHRWQQKMGGQLPWSSCHMKGC